MTKLDALVREVRTILHPYFAGAELDAAVHSIMGAIIDAAMRCPVSEPEGPNEVEEQVRSEASQP